MPRSDRLQRPLARPAQQGLDRVRRLRLRRLRKAAPSKGVDLAGYSLPERVDDLELARQRLGYGPVDLVSESAGTRTAMIYAWRYPQSIHRSVMIAVNPPGNFLWNAQDDRRADPPLRRPLRPRAGLPQPDEQPHSLGPLRLRQDPQSLLVPADQEGQRPDCRLLRPHERHSGGGGPIAAPKTIDTLLSIDQGGGAGGAWLLSLFAGIAFPRAQVWGDVASVARTDAAYGKRFFASGKNRGSVIGSPGTDFVWAGGRLLNAWPANPDEKEYNSVRDSNVPTLLIGGQLDFATPPQNATRQLLPHLRNGHEVVLPKLGHADDFWAYQPAASTRLIDTYLDSGRVDTSRYTTNQLDFTPSTTQERIAEIAVSVFLAFAALAVLSAPLVLPSAPPRREFGRKTSVAVRSLFPLLLGFGGWCLGALVALVALPTVPITDATLAVVSIATPVALAVYTGWFRSSAPRGVAALVAIATAALGAWLGYQVPHAPGFGAVTAIIAATLAANLGLIALDIAAPVTADAAVPGPARAATAPGPA